MTPTYPPPITSTQAGSWANSTVSKRWPEITRRVISENQYPDQIENMLAALQEEILTGHIRQLEEREAPDLDAWETYVQPYLGMTWFEVPWFFGEHYFYRRLMEAVGYFSTRQDPFLHQKDQGLLTTDRDIQSYAAVLAAGSEAATPWAGRVQESLLFSIWGNQADLSLWPAEAIETPKHATRAVLHEHLLVDHSQRIIQTLEREAGPGRRIDLMLDNAGFELVCDLGLADVLLEGDLASEIILHVKAHPTFVSDVILADVIRTIRYLCASPAAAVSALGSRLEGYLGEARLIPREDFFWNSPLAMWELPPDLRGEFAPSRLLISKGDANYRRLLGDRDWDPSVPFPAAVDYLPAPLAALRTLKAEVVVGLNPDQIQLVKRLDPDWMVNGRWGLIQFAPGKAGEEAALP